ncbi:TELO2-interacting protein 1 homolog [Hyposmocoma kahamanoa]|uniref:TELO2-interacting protein 1 homolog n=1 Tax=Hyposmocoma kahamanoa TaxID=1477025 RepID=UPI000E6DA3C3|nr:TELO2-interacting protein 1 homolog [Hyposmocoma kahamanoa]
MNPDLKEAFSKIKPICDLVMVRPSAQSIASFTEKLSGVKKEVIQDLQQYMLFPFITHIKSNEIEKKYELQAIMADAMCMVLEKVAVHSFDMCLQIESGLLGLVFDNSKPGMVAVVPEELKLSIMKCLTSLMLSLEMPVRQKLLRTQIPLIAQAVFVSVHIAKLEKLRALRLAALHCLTAHTATHKKLTNKNYHIADPELEAQVVDTLSSILPGVMAALQDVATDAENPGHAVVVASLEATHRILCVTLQDKFAPKQDKEISTKDFADLVKEKSHRREVSTQNSKNILKRSPEWYAMAGEKLTIVTKSLVTLATHEHYKVRRELAVLFSRILNECSLTMQPSLPLALDIVIALTKDPSPEVASLCAGAVNGYFAQAAPATRLRALDSLSDNFFATLNSLPRILNNIGKLTALTVDFIRNRAVKEVLPHIYKYLNKSSSESLLKDAGSAYRNSQAYSLQVAALTALPSLAIDLMLSEDSLEDAMKSIDVYLSKKQPKPLQALAVKFFQTLLNYDRGATWDYLRTLCNNSNVLEPPPRATKLIKLEPVIGTPYEPADKDYESNIKLIFNISTQ